jgi:Fusaric acid resistance protein-like
VHAIGAAWRVTPGAQLDPARGIRAAVAALVPLIVLAASGHVALGAMAALGALLVSLCDVAASARVRFASLGLATLGGALLFSLGRSIGDLWWLAVPAIFVATLIAGLVTTYGRAAAAMGLFLNVTFALALGLGGGPAVALPSLFGFMIGGISVLIVGFAPATLHRLRRSPATTQAQVPPARTGEPSLAPPPEQLTFKSPVWRFAAFRAAGAAVAGEIGWLLDLSHPHWAVMVVILSVRPDLETSLIATTQRLAGTVLGVVVAELVIVAVHDPLALALMAVALMVVAFAVKDLNNALFVFFLTIMTLTLVSIPTGGLSHATALLRVLTALVGAGIALIVAYLGAKTTGMAPAAGADDALA